MNYNNALAIAESVVEILRPACLRIEIKGSLTRRSPNVGDIEIVAIPDMTPPIRKRPEFGKPLPQVYSTRLDEIVDAHRVKFDGGDGLWYLEANGPKLKKFDLVGKGIGVDLFIVTPPAQWGVIATLRTGPNKPENMFSKWLVCQRHIGGRLPNGYRVQKGAVWEGEREVAEKDLDPTKALPMPEEIDFLKFCGFDGWIEPWERVARWKK